MRAIRLEHDELVRMTAGARIIEADTQGPKVLAQADGHYLKLFRIKSVLSSARFRSRARRFAANAERLRRRGFETVRVVALYRIPHLALSAVTYVPIEGTPLRELPPDSVLVRDLATLMVRLHEGGILFRSLHLGNVLRTARGTLALINLADMRFWPWPLGVRARRRNFRHLFRYSNDRAWLEAAFQGTGTDLVTAYLESCADDTTLQRALRRLQD